MKIFDKIKKVPKKIHDRLHGYLWKCSNTRPADPEYHWSRIPNDIEEQLYDLATQQSATYVLEHMGDVSGTQDRRFILEYCTNRAAKEGLFLEFGVSRGVSINHVASFTSSTVHGFDSFQGIPEDWGHCKKGAFSTNGVLPEVRKNVKLHVGLFDETLPEFLKAHNEHISFLHIDSDLYSSAKTVLQLLHDKIVVGTVIVFDEYFNYPGWQQNEYLAFQ